MKRRSLLIATAVVIATSTTVATAAEPKSLELFGVTLKGTSRDQLRKAFKQNGLRPTREENGYWVDTYDTQGVLDGASQFQAGYVAATGKFAYAQYTFNGFLDTQLVGKVINMVSTKYGRPSSQRGNYGLGEVSAKWNMGEGMQIEVSRGWPDTTTYLSFTDSSAYNQMRAEIDAEKQAQVTQQAKAQSKAF
jgi:hypothetical protein